MAPRRRKFTVDPISPDDGVKESVRERLAELAEIHDGSLPVSAVLADAKDPSSPLHTDAGYVWDVGEAAERHWIAHTKALVSKVRVNVEYLNTRLKIPHYPRDPKKTSTYKSVLKLKSEADQAAETMQAEITRILNQIGRARSLADFFDRPEDLKALDIAAGALSARLRPKKKK